MANPEHVAKLKEGIESWNERREKNPDRQPDLSEVDLRGVNLGAPADVGDVYGAVDLTGANLYVSVPP